MPDGAKPQSFERRTSTRDWIGAAVRLPGAKPTPKPRGTKFHIYRAHGARLTFAVTAGPKPPAQVGLRKPIEWELMKTVQETGQRRVGFSEADAKKAIAEKGYLLVKLPSA
jgi:hypothetical protein